MTVGLLHTGTPYDDDFSEDGVIYHYPKTDRAPGRDAAEVEATKAAATLRLPVFVIRYTGPGESRRTVYRGWIEEWDDDSRLFLVTFGDTPPSQKSPPPSDVDPFSLHDATGRRRREVFSRPRQQRFKFDVLKRYGPKCAVCEVNVVELLDAAHVCSKKESGTDDPRNGLVLCSLHHRAFDVGFFGIEPGSLAIHCRNQGPMRDQLGISAAHLLHLKATPHESALRWHWDRWWPSYAPQTGKKEA